jgi:methionyl aminopeptidase
MIELHRPSAIERMRRAGRAAADTLAAAGALIAPGVRASDVDHFIREDTARRGGRPSQLGYGGFPAAVCVSPNDVVCHGVPHTHVVFREGDIVNVDVTTELDGYHGDCSAMFKVGDVSPEAQHVVDAAHACLMAGIAVVRPNARLGDIGAAIVEVARSRGVSVVDHYGGHGIGRRMHMDPHVAHVGVRGAGPKIRAGMTFTIEPMVNLGRKDTRDDPDGFTVRTADGSLSAQAEHTVLVTESGVEILT